MQAPRSAHWEFRADIEGLRAVAVLAVVLFHAEVPGISGGFVGVDVFFVISGFLITGLLWREVASTGTVKLSSFYGARARRLLPASAAVGVATMIGAAILLPVLQAHAAMGDGIASALYVSNYWFILRGVDYFANTLPPSPFQHYWSLGVEEQFYLVWAPMILGAAWFVRRRRGRSADQPAPSPRAFVTVLALVAFSSFLLSFVATYVVPAVAYFSLPTRAWQLALGGLVALTAVHWRRLPQRAAAVAGWTGLGLILLACVWLTPETLYPGTAAVLPTLGAVLVIGAGCAAATHGCGRVLAVSPMRAVGRVSYSWYLWHWPVLVFAPLVVGHSLGLAGRLAAAMVSLGLAVLTLRYIENPLRFAPRIRSSGWRSLGLGAVATATAVCVGAALMVIVPTPIGRGVPASTLAFAVTPVPKGSPFGAYDAAVRQAFGDVQAAVAASADLRDVPSNLDPPLADAPGESNAVLFGGCLRTPFQSGQPECAAGDIESTTTVALVGDSHAAMWNPAFRKVADERRWRLEMMAKGACPLLDLPITNPLRRLLQLVQHCEQWRAEIMERLRAERPQLVVLGSWRGYGAEESLTGFRAYDSVWLQSLTRLVQQLRDTGAEVLVLGPVPNPQASVPICLSGHLDDVAACSPDRSVAVDGAGIAAETAATEAAGGHYVDVTDLFCTDRRCPVIVGNTLVYFDSYHLTIEYSELLAPVAGALADRAMVHV
ncbi:acyltransferase family protein [Mycolicibacterium sp. BiH015]|nr:acyltransferase family protein [Mycolicibacterium sp. BiH015]MDA2890731.1 acyltransferase family protein [Mycolicibacterium sp. BiH015]